MSGAPTGVDTEQNTDNIHNEGMSREDAYRLGVTEVNKDDPTIFIDPDKIRIRPPGPPGKRIGSPDSAAGQSLERQIERQANGGTRALHDTYYEDEDEPKSVGQMARSLKNYGPAAMADLNVNGRDHGMAIIPDHSFDSKKEIVFEFTDHFDRSTRKEILENMPGTNHDWMRLIGNHEGAHAAGQEHGDSYLDTLIEETRADRITRDKLLERGQDDLALAFKDLRALAGRVDPTHSSAPLTNSTDPVTDIHLETAWEFRENADEAVDDNFDWDSYQGDAEDAQELLKENPEAYFATAQEQLDVYEAEIMAQYQESPENLDHQRAVIEAQIIIGYHKNFEDAYRRRVMGEDLPERAPIQIITQEQEDAYMANKDLHEQITAIENNMSLPLYTGEFATRTLFDNYDWESYREDVDDVYDLTILERYELKLELLEAKQDEIVNDFQNNPSLETLERMLNLEKAINETADDINGFRENRYGDEAELIKPVSFITDLDKQEFLIAHVQEEERRQEIQNEIGEVRQDHYLQARENYTEEVVFADFDWESYEGEATNPDELYDQNVAAYHNAEIAYLENMKAEALAAYEADPSYENTGKLLEAQHIINDRYDAINIDRDIYAAGPKPYQELSIEPFVPEDVEIEYYRARIEKEATPEVEADADADADATAGSNAEQVSIQEEDKGYLQSPDGSAYTADVNVAAGGEPNVDFNTGMTVSGMSMSSFFDQNVNPAPNEITLVSATEPQADQDITIDPAIHQQQDNTQSIQTLG